MSRDLLFEIGVEELPAGYVLPAQEQMERAAATMLADLRLAHEVIATVGTPRRLTLTVANVADRQPDVDEEAMGPAAKVAFDADGKPTKALLGFCQGRGVDVSAVRRIETPKGEYVTVTVHKTGKAADEVLPAALATLATRIQFPKSMRWLDDDTRFGRPVRWLVALFGDAVLPVRAFRLDAGRASQGHRFLGRGALDVPNAKGYLAALKAGFVAADCNARRDQMRAQVERLAADAGGRMVADEELLIINTFMTEWPTAYAGTFAPGYLDLPRDVIVTALREHQRFFAVEDAKAALKPMFIAVRDGDDRSLDIVRKGSQDVLVARLEDAKFYWETDLKHTPAERVEALSSVVWMEGLGSLREKADRLVSLGGWLADRLSAADKATIERAALLCKTDLLSEMIGSGKEYASLEGVMGGHYARRAGEPDAVAEAIAEHYRPRGASDALPESSAGALLAIADKLDHVSGAFVAGKIPSGSEDPLAVRRAANGVVRILIEQMRYLDLRDATMESTRSFFGESPELPQAEIMKRLGDFWRGRVDAALEDHGIAYDAREAVLEARVQLAYQNRPAASRPGWIDPAEALSRAHAIAIHRTKPEFAPLAVLFKRVSNILAKASDSLSMPLDTKLLVEPAEKALASEIERVRAKASSWWGEGDYGQILYTFLELEQPIHSFFNDVMVNVEDDSIRLNRLRLLSEVRDLFMRGWDLSKIVVEGEKG